MLRGKNILIGITGGVAAYKIPYLVRLLKKNANNVRIVMTRAAKEFVSPMTLATLSNNEVIVDIFPDSKARSIKTSTWHIDLAQWADIMLIAPATANTIAKLAHGYADNAVTVSALALRCPVVISPSMDSEMLKHRITQQNINCLREMGYFVVNPATGELASGLTGVGRMPEPKVLFRAIEGILDKTSADLKDRKILVTAGPTLESIDPIRFLSNRSSGKMGFALATAATLRGGNVTLITGPVSLQTPHNVKRINVESAEQMYRAVMKYSKAVDIIIMAAAVSDFTPIERARHKIKKDLVGNNHFLLELRKTRDILKSLSSRKKNCILVGFSLETNNEIKSAKKKLEEKQLDMIVLNNPLKKGASFGGDTNIVTIISKSGKVEKLGKMSKFDVANKILDRIVKILPN